MAFSDPVSISVMGAASTLPRIKAAPLDCTYRTADENTQLRISHQLAKNRVRRMIRLDHTRQCEDPLTATQQMLSCGIYLVIDEPKIGFSDAQIAGLVGDLITFLTANSSANVMKVLGSET